MLEDKSVQISIDYYVFATKYSPHGNISTNHFLPNVVMSDPVATIRKTPQSTSN